MTRMTKFLGVGLGVVAVVAVAALALSGGLGRQIGAAREGIRAPGPLISRGYTEAPAGTAVIAGNPSGGAVLLELRVIDGQKVKRNDIIAVLSNYPAADVAVRSAEAELVKARQKREAMVSGFRLAELVMQ